MNEVIRFPAQPRVVEDPLSEIERARPHYAALWRAHRQTTRALLAVIPSGELTYADLREDLATMTISLQQILELLAFEIPNQPDQPPAGAA